MMTEADVEDPGLGEDELLAHLTEQLEAADSLALDERLALLRGTEEAISRSLEGLDGL